MRMHTRVGLGVGGIGFVLVFLARSVAELGALALVALVAVLAGLAMAKWLPRDWYGRQFEAGARAGAVACGLAVAGLICALSLSGQHSIPALARRSHLLGLNLGPAVRALGFTGWVLPTLLLSIAAILLGTGVAALVALVAGWDKNRHAIQVVLRAREAAQRSGRPAGTAPGAASIWAPPASAPSAPSFDPPGQPVRFPRPSDVTAESGQPSPVRDAFAAWAFPQDAQTNADANKAAGKARPNQAPRKRTEDDDWLC